MFPRAVKRYSSSSSASARAGIKNILLASNEGATAAGIPPEELSYQTNAFEDGDASHSPSPIGTPLSSRRPSLSSAALASRRNSTRSSLLTSGMTPLTPSEPTASSPISPSSARAFSTSTPAQSEEHGSYQFSPKEMAAVKKRVEEEFMLKSVTRSPLRTVRPSAKVPYEEVTHPDGRARHPSGFVVPAPGDPPSSLQSETRLRPEDLAKRGIPESVLTFADLKEMATAEQTTRSAKVPQEVRTSNGRVEHPSGFIPPSPQQPHMSGVKELYKPAVNLGAADGNARN